MRPALFLLLLLSGASQAQTPNDAPLIQPVPGGYFINEPGMTKLNTELADYQRERADLRARCARLETDIRVAASRPALTWKSAVLLLVAGAIVGGTVVAIAAGAH